MRDTHKSGDSEFAAARLASQFALGLSADGKVIVGAGVNPDNVTEAYCAVVP